MRSNSGTSGTGPMRTRNILRPAMRSSRTKILPYPPPRNLAAKRSALAGSAKAPACTNSTVRTAEVGADPASTVPEPDVAAAADAVPGDAVPGDAVPADAAAPAWPLDRLAGAALKSGAPGSGVVAGKS